MTHMSYEYEYHVSVVVSQHPVVDPSHIPPGEEGLETEHRLDQFGPKGDGGVGWRHTQLLTHSRHVIPHHRQLK